jgi:transposase
VRAVLNGVMYILSTGCQWAALPKDLPPCSTVNDYLRRWDGDRTLDRIHHTLYVLCREHAGREASPTAAIIDSQSVKGAEKGGLHRPLGLRRRQEDQGQEAPCPGQHLRPADAGDHPRCRHPGPRCWRVAISELTHAGLAAARARGPLLRCVRGSRLATCTDSGPGGALCAIRRPSQRPTAWPWMCRLRMSPSTTLRLRPALQRWQGASGARQSPHTPAGPDL